MENKTDFKIDVTQAGISNATMFSFCVILTPKSHKTSKALLGNSFNNSISSNIMISLRVNGVQVGYPSILRH